MEGELSVKQEQKTKKIASHLKRRARSGKRAWK